jgi:hypothetical protein
MRKEVPLLLTAVSGILVVVSEYFKFAQNLNWLTTANSVFQVATAIALPVGLVSLSIVHAHTVSRKRQGWPFSLLLLVATYTYTISGLITGPSSGSMMTWLYTTVVSPASATLYGMVAFVITSACFRTFRFRSRETAVMIIAAVFIMLGQAPIGDALWSRWGDVAIWITNFPSSAAFRALYLGAYLGAFATAVRILLGIERAHIGSVAK